MMLTGGCTISRSPFEVGDLAQRLVFPGEMNVADIFERESVGGAARAGIQHRNMLVERLQIGARFVLRVAATDGGAPGRESAELAIAGGSRNPA